MKGFGAVWGRSRRLNPRVREQCHLGISHRDNGCPGKCRLLASVPPMNRNVRHDLLFVKGKKLVLVIVSDLGLVS